MCCARCLAWFPAMSTRLWRGLGADGVQPATPGQETSSASCWLWTSSPLMAVWQPQRCTAVRTACPTHQRPSSASQNHREYFQVGREKHVGLCAVECDEKGFRSLRNQKHRLLPPTPRGQLGALMAFIDRSWTNYPENRVLQPLSLCATG